MTVPPRGARLRRGGRRPGWLLLTVLLVLAILASSALVFTDRVELLKLAVILALWAAVVAAFVSVIYRRQSDLDQAKARDLKLVYDLQLDREISARREYELTVETELRRELASELRAQAADEVAALRAELAALRTNLEILFDTDLAHRPAIETDRTTVRAAGRVTARRLDISDVEVTDIRTEESPIIDVPAVPHPPEAEWVDPGGAHRLSSQPVSVPEQNRRRRRRTEEPPRRPPAPPRRPAPESRPAEPPPSAWAPPPPPPTMPPLTPSPTIDQPAATRRPGEQPNGWQPAPAEGQWIPAGAPGSNWVAPQGNNPVPEPEKKPEPETAPAPDTAPEYVGRRRAREQPVAPDPVAPVEPVAPEPVAPEPPVPVEPQAQPTGLDVSAQPTGLDLSAQPTELDVSAQPTPTMSAPPRGRHSAGAPAPESGRHAGTPPGPVLATESSAPPEPESRHRRRAEPEPVKGNHEDGQSAAELLARFQAAPVEGGRRRRRAE